MHTTTHAGQEFDLVIKGAMRIKVGEHEDIEYMTQPELIDEKWGDRVDLIIDGGEGGTEQSTIVSCEL